MTAAVQMMMKSLAVTAGTVDLSCRSGVMMMMMQKSKKRVGQKGQQRVWLKRLVL